MLIIFLKSKFSVSKWQFSVLKMQRHTFHAQTRLTRLFEWCLTYILCYENCVLDFAHCKSTFTILQIAKAHLQFWKLPKHTFQAQTRLTILFEWCLTYILCYENCVLDFANCKSTFTILKIAKAHLHFESCESPFSL